MDLNLNLKPEVYLLNLNKRKLLRKKRVFSGKQSRDLNSMEHQQVKHFNTNGRGQSHITLKKECQCIIDSWCKWKKERECNEKK